MISTHDALATLEQYVERHNYSGYDCYDGLNSRLLRSLAFHPLLRIAVIQGMKRCPINLRPVLRVSPGHNPKGLGLFLSAVVKQYRLSEDKKYLKKLEYLANLLDSLSSKGYSGPCWGYNFDWQSRVFYVPKGTPTIVNTAYVGHAFLDAYELTKDPRYLDTARGSCEFILNDLHRTIDDDVICFSYTPIDKLKVHNANILGAGLLARVSSFSKDKELRETATRAVRYVMNHQRPDGSWHYAETHIQDWVDSFHTGFILESLNTYIVSTGNRQWQPDLLRGYTFYINNFFLGDGTPKYYHNRTFPIDIHSAAQAIVTLTGLRSLHSGSNDLLERVLTWTLSKMRHESGYFYFQKHRSFTNKIPYMRWSQAWMYHALTTYMLDMKGSQKI